MIDAPKRLQRMLLRLQKYDIDIVYTRGKEMHIADALSRAYLPYCHTHDTGDHVLAVELQEIDLIDDFDMSANGLQEPDNTRADNENAQLRVSGRDVFSMQCTSCRRISTTQRPPVDTHSTLNVSASSGQSPRGVAVARSGRLMKSPLKFKDYNMK